MPVSIMARCSLARDGVLTFWCLRWRPIYAAVNWDIPGPHNLDRYAIKSTRDRLRLPRGYQHPRPRPTNGRTFNYLFSLSYREKRDDAPVPGRESRCL